MPIITTLDTSRPSEGTTEPAGVSGGGKIAQAVARDEDLPDNLLGSQVAHQLLRAGMAERAGERTADLGGDAERAAALLGDIDRLRLDRTSGAAGGKAQQPFARAVA
jgi:hypothetical protein